MQGKKSTPGLGPQTLVQLDQEQSEPEDLQIQDSDSKLCLSSIGQIQVSRDMFILGLPFMKKYYTIFDRDHDRVGLAEAIW